MKKNQLLSSAVLLLAAVIWGLAFVAQNELADTVPPFAVNATRSFIACVALIPVAYVTRRIKGKKLTEDSKADRKRLLKASLVCGTMLCISVNIQQFGIAMYPEGAPVEAHSGFLTAMYIMFVPLIGLFLGKRPSPFVIVGIVTAIVGLYLLCLSDGLEAFYAADIFGLLCGLSFAIQILCVDHFIVSVDPVKLSSIQFLLCGSLSAILSLIFEHADPTAILDSWRPILYLALMSSAVGYTLQIVGQKYSANPALASIIMSMESVFAALGGIIFTGVMPKTAELIGCVVMFAAIIIAQLPEDLFTKKRKALQ